jgi:hypothetical protein
MTVAGKGSRTWRPSKGVRAPKKRPWYCLTKMLKKGRERHYGSHHSLLTLALLRDTIEHVGIGYCLLEFVGEQCLIGAR